MATGGTSGINAINLQVMAEDRIAADRANGTYDQNLAGDPAYYIWKGDLQTFPMGMDDNPEQFAAQLRVALPQVNTLRLPFNAYSFNPDGSLNEQYERFLAAAAAEGFQIIFVYSDGDSQSFARGTDATPDQIHAALQGEIYTRMENAWTSLMDWTDANPEVKQAVYGYEVVNEPASFERGADRAAKGEDATELARFVELYVTQVSAISDLVQARAPGHILVGGWGYSARFQEFDDVMIGGVSALDAIRAAVGGNLIWSSHFYPGWQGTKSVQSPDEVVAAYESLYGVLGDDAILVTETNLYGPSVYDYEATTPYVLQFARSAEWMADNGIGTTWFPGAETGGSNLVVIDADGSLRFLHQDSYGAAMNAYSLGENPGANAGNETLNATLIAARLRNEANDPTIGPDTPFDPVNFLGIAFGYGGDDRLIGSSLANNFLYGGAGNDDLAGSVNDDFLYGQDGDDVLISGAGNDQLFGGRGNDTLIAGAGENLAEGGAGVDRFILDDSGNTVVSDFNPTIGETFDFGTLYGSFQEVLARAEILALNGTAADDAVIRHDNGTTTTFLDIGDYFTTELNVPVGLPGVFDGTARDDRIQAGSVDRDGEIFGAGTYEVRGGFGDDLILGTDAGEVLYGDEGADRIGGRRGDDTILGGAGDDVLSGQKGNNAIYGGDGDDILNTGSHSSLVDGGNGDDVLIAHFGNGGTHRMIGGQGFDSFEIPRLNPDRAAHASIEDFDPASDRLRVEGETVDFNDLPAGFSAVDTPDGVLLSMGASASSVLLGGVTLAQLRNAPDGRVSGTDMDDTIDAAYVDAQGDSLGNQNPFLSYSVDAGDGNDTILATARSELLIGGAGDDIIRAGAGSDTIFAGAGNDVVFGGSGNNTISGGAGDDWLNAGNKDSRASGGTGNDILRVNARKDAAFTLTGGAGNDVFDLTGDRAGNGAYVRVTDFGAGEDRLKIGGITLDLSGASAAVLRVQTAAGVELSLGGGGARFLLEGLSIADLAAARPDDGVATVYGTGQDDVIDAGFVDASGQSVTGRDNIVRAGGGDDVVNPGDGSDTVFGGDGNDRIRLGGGNDTGYGGDGDDVIFGQRGTNAIHGGAGNDRLYSGRGASLVDGGDGDDTLRIDIRRADQTATGGDGADRFILTGVQAGKVTDSVVTDFTPGEDSLVIAGQDINLEYLPDTMSGANSPDGYVLVLENGTTVLFAGLAITPLAEAPAENAVTGTPGDDIITLAFVDSDGTPVTDGNDIIHGLGGADTIRGEAGNDILRGGAGDDRLIGGAGNDVIHGGEGDDTLIGDKGRNTLYGEAGDDILHSGRHSSVLDGGAGNDRLIGDIGRAGQVLTGGAGADSFEFNTVRAGKTSNSTVTDFVYGEDSLIIAGAEIDLAALAPPYTGVQLDNGYLLDLGGGSSILFEGLLI